MEELTADELHGVLENPDTTREDLVAAATQLGRREGRAEGQAEGRAEGLEERRMLQHLLTMSSDKSAIIIDHMTQQLQTHQEQRQADEKELRTKTAEIAALRCRLLLTAVDCMYIRPPMACAIQASRLSTW